MYLMMYFIPDTGYIGNRDMMQYFLSRLFLRNALNMNLSSNPVVEKELERLPNNTGQPIRVVKQSLLRTCQIYQKLVASFYIHLVSRTNWSSGIL